MKRTGWIILAIVAVLVIWGISVQRGLVTYDENVKKSFGDLQSSYQRRSDLIPNLVNTVKGAADFEKSTLTQVVEARAKATSVNISADDLTPEKLEQFQQAQAQISSSLGRLIAVAEAYPTLKTNENFLNLQAQLEGTENRINVARNDYNGVVNTYNVKVRRFPTNLFAGLFGYKVKPTFQAAPGSEQAPEVKF